MIKGDVSSCSEAKKLKTSRACPKFKTEPSAIGEILKDEDKAEGFQEIASLVNSMDTKNLRAFAGAILNEVTTRKQGFYMWQPVYIRYRGTARSNYMSNFMTARILNADSEMIRLVSEDGVTVMRYPNTGLQGPAMYSKEAFQEIKERMIDRGLHVDPSEKTTRNLRPIDIDEDLAMPPVSKRGGIASIDDVKRSNRRLTKKKDSILDLTHIAQNIENGTADYVDHSSNGEARLNPKNESYYRSSKGNREIEAGDLN